MRELLSGEQRYRPEEVRQFPEKPGVYRFYDRAVKLIYVGKAKNLKARVSSYFNDPSGQNGKTRRMVAAIGHIEFTLVDSEFDALLLENNLIKSQQPRYNILLRDDKTFPYICIASESFPRIYPTRRPDPGKGRYFGPYTGVRAMKSVVELIRSLCHIRTCKLNLSAAQIARKKYKVCLEYHLGRCKAPCVGLQDEADYALDIRQAEHILRGNLAPVKQHFRDEMMAAAEALAFERAQQMKEKLELIERFQARTVVVNTRIGDVDVFAVVSDEKRAYINYLRIADGSIVLSKTYEVAKKLDEQDEELLSQVIFDCRSLYKSEAPEILVNVMPTFGFGDECKVPRIGDKRKLVELALKNALYYKKERNTRAEDQPYRELRVLQQLQSDLRMEALPEHIECFDNSNLQGREPVAAMVCFRKGRPSKKDYRKYNIRTVEGPDDFASMYEVVHRRYRRLQEEDQPLPQLVVIDGGKGQLSAAARALRDLGLYGRMAIIGIAKRLEEIYFPDDPLPLHLGKKTESLRMLQHLRNETHRFAITFHRARRSKRAIRTELTGVPGIGAQTAQKLLKTFRSLRKIREAPLPELEALIGKAKASALMDALNAGKLDFSMHKDGQVGPSGGQH
jgi:excinuclease ABC subunit C